MSIINESLNFYQIGLNYQKADAEIRGLFSLDENSKIIHGLDDENGKTYYVIEWRDLDFTELDGKTGSFQMRIENYTGTISFHYGPTTADKGSPSKEGIQCGVFMLTNDFQQVVKMTELIPVCQPGHPATKELAHRQR